MSYMTKDQLESYLNGLPKNTPKKKEYNQIKNELVYPMEKLSVKEDIEEQELGSIKDRMHRLRTATGTALPAKEVMTPAFPKTPTPQVASKPTFISPTHDAFEASLAPRQKTKRPVSKQPPPLSSPSLPTPPPPPPLPTSTPPPAIPDSPRPPRPDTKVNTLNPLYAGLDCPGCQQPIQGTVVSAMDKVWHATCFVCTSCQKPLEKEEYFVHEQQPFCAKDYQSMFSLRCDYCHEPITKTAIRALGKHYHEGHFCCVVCQTPLDDHSAFMVHEGQPYCQDDYKKSYSKKCNGCGDYLVGQYINALGQAWHPTCFVCTECKQPFKGGSFIVRDNQPYCEHHQSKSTIKPKPVFNKPHEFSPTATTAKPNPLSPSTPSTKPSIHTAKPTPPSPRTPSTRAPSVTPSTSNMKQCHHCGQQIDGPCASALGHDYHIHHFQCSQCQRTLSSRVPGMWTGNSQNELVCKSCKIK
ncbi:Transforming growth factor beta-1-induced transcript 1 protein [Choanephora cucurbitarum]|uniref:Transforming growth factor beta-1-induced transcript 1 protein n=1 Tax=Choanephora cucurbitarum TaxID=101091 RepID=A0A1C7N9Y2_9FUNG|nr:Transforming growth factor beta-1-induced transcript 1 protein [Choanephora cucurbitarum]